MTTLQDPPTVTAPEPAAPAPRKRRRHRSAAAHQLGGSPLTYLLLFVSAGVAILPLYWTLVIASHTNHENGETPPPFVPNGSIFHYMSEAMSEAPIAKGLINSVIVSGCIAVGTTLFCTLSGFAFAKLRFRGSKFLFGLTIGTMMVPTQLGIIPLFMLMARLHWGDHLQAVILPTLVSAFGVFFMRQYLTQALPTELLEAGWVDGASTFRIFRSIVLPIARPAMAVLAMLTFLTAWNDFFWPIVALSTQNPTVQVAMNGLGHGYVPEQAVIMAGTVLGTIPVLIVFAVLGKQIVGGIMQGAVKG